MDVFVISGEDFELSMHDGTVRDVCFIEDSSNKSSLLISGGAGDCKIYVTDCLTGTPFQALSGHTGETLSALCYIYCFIFCHPILLNNLWYLPGQPELFLDS